MFADVALPFGNFTYYIPKRLSDKIKIGSIVSVPIKNNYFNGVVIKIKEGANIKNIKKINKVYPFYISPLLIKLSKNLASYYHTEMGSFLELMLPPITKYKVEPVSSDAIPEINTHCPSIIKKAIDDKKFKYILIHGADRTQIYISAIYYAIKNGFSVIFLSPEINLAHQVYSKLQKIFGNIVVLYHSRLKKEFRLANWLKIGTKIIVGSIGAVFVPLDNLGLIIVDEENSPTYKSEKYPKYSAKFVSFMRAKLSDCVCIYGSTSPSIEAYYMARNSIIKLGNRRGIVHIVDMRKESNPIFSNILIDKLKKYIKKGEKILLFVNKRGFCSFLLCEDCGYVPKCKYCEISLTYHKEILMCHYCGYEEKVFGLCPICNGVNISYKGVGTVRIENYIKKLFPGVNILRVDIDTVSTKYLMHIFNSFISGDTQILIGTQMLVKSIDFPSVGLVGIISADYGLNLPDFMAAERTYNLITNLIHKGKEIIIQTNNIGHPVIKYISNYKKFYEEELRLRQLHNYPPYSHLIRLVVEGKKESYVKDKIQKLYTKLLSNKNIEILGPAPCFIPYKKNKYRYHLLIKTNNVEEIDLPKKVIFDIDPVDFT